MFDVKGPGGLVGSGAMDEIRFWTVQRPHAEGPFSASLIRVLAGEAATAELFVHKTRFAGKMLALRQAVGVKIDCARYLGNCAKRRGAL